MGNHYGLIEKLSDTTILNLGEIIRYNNRRKIKNENVAEHSFYVVASVVRICNYYSINEHDTLKAMRFAVAHDLPEIELGDVPFETKENNPLIKEAIEEAELNSMVASESLKTFYMDYKNFVKEEKEKTLVYLVVKLADTLSVLQYSNREIELGNTSKEMKQIHSGAYMRVTKYIEEIEGKLF